MSYKDADPSKFTSKFSDFVQKTGLIVKQLPPEDHNDYVFILHDKYIGMQGFCWENDLLIDFLKIEFQ